MASIFLFITLFICIKIIFCKNPTNRMYWYIGSLLCLNDHVEVYGLINASMIIEVSAILSIAREGKLRIYSKMFPLIVPLILLFFSHLMIGIMDIRLPISQGVIRGITSFVSSYLMLYTGYLLSFNVQFKDLQKMLILFFCIIGIYTIGEFITGSNPYYDMVETMYGKENNIWTLAGGLGSERGQRCMGTQSNPIYYGLLLATIGLFILANRYLKGKSKYFLLMIFAVSLIATKSRTPMVTFVLMFIIYLWTTVSIGKTIQVLFAATIAIVTLSYFIPIFDTLLSSLFEFASTGESNLEGSSSELRMEQLATSYLYFLNNPIWGNGYFYFSENIFSEKTAMFGGLAGMEGYIFELLIEQGVVQMFFVIVFWTRCFIRFFQFRKRERQIAYMGISLCTGFLFFIISTGANGAWLYAMPFIGILMNKCQITNLNTHKNVSKKDKTRPQVLFA